MTVDPYQPPASGLVPPPPPGGPHGNLPAFPWDERQTRGFGSAFVESVQLLAKSPTEGFSRLRPDGEYVGPFIFGLIISWTMFLVGQVWNMMFSSFMPFEDLGMTAGSTLIQAAIWVIFYPVVFALYLFLFSGIYHLCLVLFSGLGHSQHGFEGTYKVLAYSQVAMLVGVIPLLGAIIGMILQIILLVVGFQAVHKTDQGRAIAAALVPLLLCCACAIAIAATFGAAIAAAVAGAQ